MGQVIKACRVFNLSNRKSRRKFVHFGARLRYPWEEMEEGDFFDVPQDRVSPGSVSANACSYAREHPGYKFETSTLINRDGVRITRVVRVYKSGINWFSVDP